MIIKPDSLLEKAKKHLFVAGVGDTAEKLTSLNMAHGLAKIHHYQITRGLFPDCIFIGAPDATVTRNANRWLRGIGYGGLISWSGDFSILDIKPNGCGMLMGLLPELPPKESVKKRWQELRRNPLRIDSRKIEWDLGAGNHFIILCTPRETEEKWNLPWKGPVFILHSSGKENRGETELGPGLYWDQSRKLQKVMVTHSTPWGDLSVLEGIHAQEYHRHCINVHSFQMKRRRLLAEALLGEYETLFNGTHQGIHSPGNAVVGCYKFGPPELSHMIQGPDNPDNPVVFPLTLRPDLPVYLLEPAQNFIPEVLEEMGWNDRLAEIGATRRVQESNLLPHGGGTAYKYLQNPWVLRENGQRIFGAEIVDTPDRKSIFERLEHLTDVVADKRTVTFKHPRNLPFTYRGKEVLDRTLECRMGRKRGSLQICWSLGGKK